MWLEPGFEPGVLAPAAASLPYGPLWISWKKPLSEKENQTVGNLAGYSFINEFR